MAIENEGRKLLGMIQKTKGAMPDLLNEAVESDDYTKVDYAKNILDRLITTADKINSEISTRTGKVKQEAPPPPTSRPLDIIRPGDPRIPQDEPSAIPPPSTWRPIDIIKPGDPRIPQDEAPPSFPPFMPYDSDFGEEKPPPSLGGATGSWGDAADPDAIVPGGGLDEVRKLVFDDFGDDPNALLESVRPYAKTRMENEFLERINSELGKRPEKFTFDKLLMALAIGLGGMTRAWATGRYGGIPIDLTQDIRDYDARKAQIGREVYGQYKAEERQNRSIAAQQLRDNLRRIGDGGLSTSEKVATIHANASLIRQQMSMANNQQRNASKAYEERKQSIEKQYNTLADFYTSAVKAGTMKPEAAQAEFDAKSGPLLAEITDMDNKIAGVLIGK